jgi:hypothetical protein
MHSAKLEHAVQQLRDALRKAVRCGEGVGHGAAAGGAAEMGKLRLPASYSRSETATEGSSVLQALLEEEGPKYG